MSDILGNGFGSRHEWVKKGSFKPGKRDRYSVYICQDCHVKFVHEYILEPDISVALKYAGIPDVCDEWV